MGWRESYYQTGIKPLFIKRTTVDTSVPPVSKSTFLMTKHSQQSQPNNYVSMKIHVSPRLSYNRICDFPITLLFVIRTQILTETQTSLLSALISLAFMLLSAPVFSF